MRKSEKDACMKAFLKWYCCVGRMTEKLVVNGCDEGTSDRSCRRKKLTVPVNEIVK